ncbi:hypothetical protein AB4Z50_09540 [Paenibacillus sp. 2TAB26]|uniref:hypothetical protein n=1 Tax=Paenibacillus sp. 2TAB26 TaxID=3233005 RepID=UPI003F97F05F
MGAILERIDYAAVAIAAASIVVDLGVNPFTSIKLSAEFAPEIPVPLNVQYSTRVPSAPSLISICSAVIPGPKVVYLIVLPMTVCS